MFRCSSFLLLLFGALLIVAAAVFWLLPDGPVEPRLPLSVFGPLLLIAGWLSWKYYEPAEKRSVRLACQPLFVPRDSDHRGWTRSAFRTDPDAAAMAGQKPANERTRAPRASEKTEAKADIAQPAEPAAAPAAVGPAAAATKADAKGEASPDKKVEEKKPGKPQQSKEERAAERKAEREKQLAEAKTEKEKERRIFTSGSYWETVEVEWRPVPGKSR